ncbi:vacuolar protein sorting-associated protein 37B isoform X1 [Eulemur rufifrons]|uniref:vacuolar protein sorting-associated protein 37B isoform X1 n=1 Tax=Eulemur rufifrons TaxID=859984 RepID=UPI003743FB63
MCVLGVRRHSDAERKLGLPCWHHIQTAALGADVVMLAPGHSFCAVVPLWILRPLLRALSRCDCPVAFPVEMTFSDRNGKVSGWVSSAGTVWMPLTALCLSLLPDKQSSSASLETLLALLQAEGAKIEEDTENMAEKFLDGELPLDSFIDVYQSKRKLAHMRRVKIEKLQEMVLKGQRLPQAPAPLPPRVPEPASAAPLPYPALEASGPPSVVPRRIPPPPPPVPAGRLATPFTAAMGSGQAVPYPGLQCPPLPPRVGLPPQQGFSAQFVSPYPPALPQRPPPRLPPHQPGFILQ